MVGDAPTQVAGSILFGLSRQRGGYFFCLDARTGSTLWTSDGGQGENAAILSAGEVLFFLKATISTRPRKCLWWSGMPAIQCSVPWWTDADNHYGVNILGDIQIMSSDEMEVKP